MKFIDSQQSAKTNSRPVQIFKPKIKFIPDASIFKNLGITSDNITNLQKDAENEKSVESSTQDFPKLDPQTASKPELQKLCGNYGIAKSGTKKLLIERLIKNGILKPEHPEEEKNWSSKSKREDLMVACTKRVLATDGSKSDLMQRLQQYEDTRTKLYIIGGISLNCRLGQSVQEIGGNTKDKLVEENGEITIVASNTNDDLAVKKRRLSDENSNGKSKLEHPTIVTLEESMDISNESVNEQSKALHAKEDKSKALHAKEDKEHNVDVSDLLDSDTDDELSDGDFENPSKKSCGDSDEEISFRKNENLEKQSKESSEDTDEEISDDDFDKLYNQIDTNDTKREHKDVEKKMVEESVTVISVCAKKVDSSPTQYCPSFVCHYVTLVTKPGENEDPEVAAAEEVQTKTKAKPSFFAWGSFVNSSGSPEKVKFIS